jgi:ribose/xylose/arabinose/galactoside ABC-type transport system permease subunit
VKKLIKRLREPSTYAGLSAFAVLFGIPPGTIDVLVQAVVAVSAAAAVLLPEKAAA